MAVFAEYIWIDGVKPTAGLRSKTKVIYDNNVPSSTAVGNVTEIDPSWFPEWGADGSSTELATGSDSDIVLRPVSAVRDPFRPGHYLVMTEVYEGAVDKTHVSNHRADLRAVLAAGADEAESLFGFEQEYTFLSSRNRPLGFPEEGYPSPQGPYYCGVGEGRIFGREVYEDFLNNCLSAGIVLSGVNWEVVPGQAEIQVGPLDPLTAGDHIWFARWILARTAEEYGVRLTDEVDRQSNLAIERGHKVERLMHELLDAEQYERARIRRLIHDELQQILVSSRMQAALLRDASQGLATALEAESLASIVHQIDEALECTRDLTLQLAPASYERGLCGALVELCEQMERRYGLHVALNPMRASGLSSRSGV